MIFSFTKLPIFLSMSKNKMWFQYRNHISVWNIWSSSKNKQPINEKNLGIKKKSKEKKSQPRGKEGEKETTSKEKQKQNLNIINITIYSQISYF